MINVILSFLVYIVDELYFTFPVCDIETLKHLWNIIDD